jgi:hypothetical protein
MSVRPLHFNAFADHVVPILQRRGRFRTGTSAPRCATISDYHIQPWPGGN